jgi:hypothetical protein
VRTEEYTVSWPSFAPTVLFRSARTCCVCNERRRAVQIHHIDEVPSNHATENLAVLCLDCHNDTLISGGFGRKLNASLVIRHRDEWCAAVDRQRALTVEAALRAGAENPASFSINNAPQIPGDQTLAALPAMLAIARELAEEGWGGSTLDIVTATSDVSNVLADMLVRLARRFPEQHFGADPGEYFDTALRERAGWHSLLAEPDGVGTGGTIVRITVAGNYMQEAARMVEDMVLALWDVEDAAGLKQWQAAWRAAQADL